MKIFFASVMGVVSLSFGASLQVYQDSTVYEYTPSTTYLGMVVGADATCQGQRLSVFRDVTCDSSERLCKEHEAILSAQEALDVIETNIKTLDKIVSLHRPQMFDAKTLIETADKISQARANLIAQRDKKSASLGLQKEAFSKQTGATSALYFTKKCDKPVKLTFEYGLVSFEGFYEADILAKKEIKVTQYLAITNRSGIDILVDDAMFYYRTSGRMIRPTHFDPWIVGEYQAPVAYPRSVMAKSMTLQGAFAAPVMTTEALSVPAPQASYIDAREYKIEHLSLPSTGEPINIAITSWSVPLACSIHVTPYADTTAYEKCTFSPKTQIDTNHWRIKEHDTVVNNDGFGEYREKNYTLYTKAQEDILVSRKPMVQKESDTGFFGNTIRKKDGYVITLTNTSDKAKTVTVTERIPDSTTQKIEVKLLGITSDKKVEYTVQKEGEIEIHIALAPKEERKIEVLFELSYDKELKIAY